MVTDLIRYSVGLAARSAPIACRAKPTTSLLSLRGPDDFRVQDSYEGVQIFGGTGSGKSSGSAKAFALAYLKAGYGGLVLCAKPDEAARWHGYVKKAGRAAHLLHFQPEGALGFNFLEYEVRRPDGAGPDTFNLVNLLLKVVEAAQLAEGHGAGGGENPFWQRALREMLANTVEPLFAATGTLRIDDIMRFVGSAPTSRQDAFNDEWKGRSYLYQMMCKAMASPEGRTLPEHAMRTSADYWFRTYAELDPKTRSNITATLTSTLAPFMRGMLRDRFCTSTEIIPELTHEGAVLIVDFPVKMWGDAAVVASNIMKYQWQRATERRVVRKNTRPVFLFADECQFFLSDYDAEFQSTARSARAATVYITQNLPTYYSRLKAHDPKAAADSLLGNFQTKIFHANTDPTTNQYAADLVGRDLQRRQSENWSENAGSQQSTTRNSNWSVNVGEQRNENWSRNWGRQSGGSKGRNWGSNSSFGSSSGSNGSTTHSSNFGSSSGGSSGTSWSRSSGGGHSAGSGASWGRSAGGGYSYGDSTSQGSSAGGSWSEQMDYILQPRVFAANLRKGGKADRRLVDGVVVQGGRNFRATGAHWLPCTFKQ